MSRWRDNAAKVGALNAQVLGISADSVWANRAFADQLRADFPILSDARGEVSRAYGVYDEANGVARRTTFVVDSEGIVRHIDQGSAALDPTGAIAACPVPRRQM